VDLMKCPEEILDTFPDYFVLGLMILKDYEISDFHRDFVLAYIWTDRYDVYKIYQ